MTKFKKGQRVRLKPNKAEGWPEQFGHVDGLDGNGVYCITIDYLYREGKMDDGLRNVLSRDLEAVPKNTIPSLLTMKQIRREIAGIEALQGEDTVKVMTKEEHISNQLAKRLVKSLVLLLLLHSYTGDPQDVLTDAKIFLSSQESPAAKEAKEMIYYLECRLDNSDPYGGRA